MTAGPAPMAKSSSVVAGMSETTRRAAGRGRRPCRPRRRRCGCRPPVTAGGRQAGCQRSSATQQRRRIEPGCRKWKPPISRGRRQAVRDGNERGRQRHQPSPEGIAWWRERRGLLASGLRSPSRFPSGVVSEESASEGRARYSGGAAPVLHRFPSVPVRVLRLFCGASLSVRPPAARAPRAPP